jgi:hypothetical protein
VAVSPKTAPSGCPPEPTSVSRSKPSRPSTGLSSKTT